MTTTRFANLDNTSWYAGAGVGYNITQNFSLGLNYDYYDAKKHGLDLSTDMVSVSAEYRF
jgi:OOP family OmpA-OmpF porin